MLRKSTSIHLLTAAYMLTITRILFEFHQQQNSKKPGSIHATYLLAGVTKPEPVPTNGETKDGEDDYMQSSPFMNSSMPQPEENTGETGVLTISLVKEEDLDGRSTIRIFGALIDKSCSSEIPV